MGTQTDFEAYSKSDAAAERSKRNVLSRRLSPQTKATIKYGLNSFKEFFLNPAGSFSKSAEMLWAYLGDNQAEIDEFNIVMAQLNPEFRAAMLASEQIPAWVVGQFSRLQFLYKESASVEEFSSQLNQIPAQIQKSTTYKRPSTFWKQTVDDAFGGLPDSASGVKECPGCGAEITGKKYPVLGKDGKVRMVRDFDIDHINKIWADRAMELEARGATREEVIEEYNRFVRALCPPCNRGHRLEPPRIGKN
jgi:HNH/ENDO VII superfamily nuclease with conserved GHE residues